jgi:two-component system cell cycle response regulator CtrA
MASENLKSLRALLIEDDPTTSRSLELILRANGIMCDVASIGTEGLEIAKLYDYDIIILDLLLPDVDGYEILLRLRAAKIETPILILSGLSSIDNKIRGFSAGADDYLTKPFDKNEVLARIWAIVRRSKGLSESKVKVNNLIINLDSKTVEFNATETDTKKLDLTKSEYAILHLLALRKNSLVTKEMILNKLYESCSRDEPDIKIVDVFICNLRRKLFKISEGRKYIKTLWGRGYMLSENVGEEKKENIN